MTEPSPAVDRLQLGNGYTAEAVFDGSWLVYDPAGEYIDTCYNAAGAIEFAAGHAEVNPPAECDHDTTNPRWTPCAQCRAEFDLTDTGTASLELALSVGALLVLLLALATPI